MAVRFKLDRCGVKLSLKQWSRIGPEQRFALADRACDTINEVEAYTAALLALINICKAGQAVSLAIDPAPAWADITRVPARIIDMVAILGLTPLSLRSWARLSTLQRFALLKLTRPGHDNDNFLPAMIEFGLADEPGQRPA